MGLGLRKLAELIIAEYIEKSLQKAVREGKMGVEVEVRVRGQG